MPNLLFFLFCANVAIYAASQFQYHGYTWADQICANVFGLYNEPALLGAAALGLFIAAYLTQKYR